mgnify:CR=1 FL=1
MRKRGALNNSCRVVLMKPPTVVGEGGFYNSFTAPIPVKVCKVGRGVRAEFPTTDFGTVTVTLSGARRQAEKYMRLSRKLPCPGARSMAAQLAREWGEFYRGLSRVVKGV